MREKGSQISTKEEEHWLGKEAFYSSQKNKLTSKACGFLLAYLRQEK
jgi:hypothetical protein